MTIKYCDQCGCKLENSGIRIEATIKQLSENFYIGSPVEVCDRCADIIEERIKNILGAVSFKPPDSIDIETAAQAEKPETAASAPETPA